MVDMDDLIAEARKYAKKKRGNGWIEMADIVDRLADALESVRAERDAALARIAEAAKLHRKAHAVFSWATGGVRYEDPCPDCDGKAGVHDCGCWADADIEYHCAECDGSRERASWPCPTAVALGLNEGENDEV